MRLSLLMAFALGFILLPSGSVSAQTVPANVAFITMADEIDIGSFCLSHIPRGSIKVGASRILPGGIWWEISVHITSQNSNNPIAYFFSKPRQPATDGHITKCSDSAPLAVLKGRLNTAVISAYFLPPAPGQPSRWQVDPGKLDVEFGRAEASISPLFGGAVVASDAKPGVRTLLGRKLWVTNPSVPLFFDGSANVQTGVLVVTTTDVALAGVSIREGTTDIKTNLLCLSDQPRPQAEVKFSLNVSTSAAGFLSGQCVQRAIAVPPGTWTGAGANVSFSKGTVSRVELAGSGNSLSFSYLGTTLIADKISFADHGVIITPSQSVSIGSLSGPTSSDPDEISIDNPTWTQVVTDNAGIAIERTFPLTGNGKLEVAVLSSSNVDASLDINSPQMPKLSAVAPILADKLSFRATGNPKTPFISGFSSVRSFRLRSLGLSGGLGDVAFQSSTTADVPTFSFDLDSSSPTSSVAIGDPGGASVEVSGGLTKAHIKGDLMVDPQTAMPSITIKPGDLILNAGFQASAGPLLLGSPVQFVGGQVLLNNPTQLTIASPASSGQLNLEASGLIFPTPNLSFDDPSHNLRISAPISTEGAATIDFSLDTGSATLYSAQIDIVALSAKAADAPQPVSFAGINLICPDLTIGELTLSVVEGTGLAKGTNFKFTTTSAQHSGNPYWNVALAPEGLTLTNFDASAVNSQSGINLTSFSIEHFSVSGTSAEFKTVDGFDVQGSGFSLVADRFSQSDISGGKAAIASGSFAVAGSPGVTAQAGFDHFAISMDGSQTSFAGTGSIHLSNIALGYKSLLHIPDCPAGQGWKVTGGIHVDGALLNLQAQQGMVGGTVTVNSGSGYVVNDGESQCGWDHTYKISDAKWADINLCPPFHCEVKTIIFPEIDVTIYWEADLISLNASASIQEATLSVGGGSGAKLCLKRMTLSPPLIVATYSPQVKSGSFIADFVHDLIRIVAAGIESPIASLIGTDVSFTSYIAAALGTTYCFQ